jgi:hypothetical protein
MVSKNSQTNCILFPLHLLITLSINKNAPPPLVNQSKKVFFRLPYFLAGPLIAEIWPTPIACILLTSKLTSQAWQHTLNDRVRIQGTQLRHRQMVDCES